MVCTNIVLALFFSLTAYFFDRKSGRIPNHLIMLGLLTGLIYVIRENGYTGIAGAIISMAWPILLLYVLFLLRVLGAGDIKLFSVISVFLDHHQMLTVIYLSFLAGAAVAVFRIIKYKKAAAVLQNFHNYVQTIIITGKINAYSLADNGIGTLHFAGCIFAAVLMLILREEMVFYGLF